MSSSVDAEHGLLEDLVRRLGLAPTRTRLLAIVARSGTSTAAELMAQLGIGRSAVANYTRELEQAGLLVQGPDPERRDSTGGGSNRLVWSVDRDAVRGLLRELEQALLGED